MTAAREAGWTSFASIAPHSGSPHQQYPSFQLPARDPIFLDSSLEGESGRICQTVSLLTTEEEIQPAPSGDQPDLSSSSDDRPATLASRSSDINIDIIDAKGIRSAYDTEESGHQEGAEAKRTHRREGGEQAFSFDGQAPKAGKTSAVRASWLSDLDDDDVELPPGILDSQRDVEKTEAELRDIEEEIRKLEEELEDPPCDYDEDDDDDEEDFNSEEEEDNEEPSVQGIRYGKVVVSKVGKEEKEQEKDEGEERKQSLMEEIRQMREELEVLEREEGVADVEEEETEEEEEAEMEGLEPRSRMERLRDEIEDLKEEISILEEEEDEEEEDGEEEEGDQEEDWEKGKGREEGGQEDWEKGGEGEEGGEEGGGEEEAEKGVAEDGEEEEEPPLYPIEGSTDALLEELRKVDEELALIKEDMAFYGDTDSEGEDDEEEDGEEEGGQEDWEKGSERGEGEEGGRAEDGGDRSDSDPAEDDEDVDEQQEASASDRGWVELPKEEAERLITRYCKRKNLIGRGSTCSGRYILLS